jgi:hypothetical protein
VISLALERPESRKRQKTSYYAQSGQNPIGKVCRSDSSFQILFGMRFVVSVSLCILGIFFAYVRSADWWSGWAGGISMGLGTLLLLVPIHWEWFLCTDWDDHQQTEYRQQFPHNSAIVPLQALNARKP